MKISSSLLVLCLAGCATASSSSRSSDLDSRSTSASLDRLMPEEPTSGFDCAIQTGPSSPVKPPSARPEWQKGQAVMQGFFGASFYDKVSREGGGTPPVDGDAGDLDQLPLIGGGGQWKLGGERMDYGLEGFFSLEGRANAAAFAVGGGGAAVAVDVDLMIFDLYGGPFVSMFLGEKLRAYVGAGPLFQFANYDQEFSSSHDSGSGFGVGGYVRTGLELVLPSHTMVGIGALWSDSTIDLDGGLGDLKIEGYQLVLTVSRGF